MESVFLNKNAGHQMKSRETLVLKSAASAVQTERENGKKRRKMMKSKWQRKAVMRRRHHLRMTP